MFSYCHSFFLSHERKETEKMHFSLLFAIQESFKFPFFCALSLMWFHLAHDIAFNMCGSFIFKLVQLQKEKNYSHCLKITKKSHYQAKRAKRAKRATIIISCQILTTTILMQKLSSKITLFCIDTNETFLSISKHCVRLYSPFHWNWNGCWCFHKPENASRRFWGWEK